MKDQNCKQRRFISQSHMLIFTKGANISGGHCIYIFGYCVYINIYIHCNIRKYKQFLAKKL